MVRSFILRWFFVMSLQLSFFSGMLYICYFYLLVCFSSGGIVGFFRGICVGVRSFSVLYRDCMCLFCTVSGYLIGCNCIVICVLCL